MSNDYLSIDEIESRVQAIHQTLDTQKPLRAFVTFDAPVQWAIPFVSVDENGYHFIAMERGRVMVNRMTHHLQELLYWIFESITFTIACDNVFKDSRIDKWSQRRIFFKNQLDMLNQIDPFFKSKCREDILEILARHPFTDGRPNTPDYDGD